MKSLLVLFLLSLPVFIWGNPQICSEVYTGNNSFAYTQILSYANSLTPKDTGIDSKKLIEALRDDPSYKWIAESLLQDHLSFAMNRSENSRLGIARSGFLSMYESNRTSTGMTPEERIQLEAAMLGMKVSDYRKNVPLNQRPLYGYLAPPIGSKMRREREVQGYGTDIYIFKKSATSSIATWTVGDSLDRQLPVNLQGKYLTVPRFHRFMPWTHRALLLPRLKSPEPNYIPDELALQDLSNRIVLPNGKYFEYNVNADHSYIEIQFWRSTIKPKLDLDDVEVFIFKGNPPTGEFLEQLKRRNIKIFRNTSGKFDSDGVDKLWLK